MNDNGKASARRRQPRKKKTGDGDAGDNGNGPNQPKTRNTNAPRGSNGNSPDQTPNVQSNGNGQKQKKARKTNAPGNSNGIGPDQNPNVQNNGNGQKQTKDRNNNARGGKGVNRSNQALASSENDNDGGGGKRQPPQDQQTTNNKQNRRMGRRAKQLETVQKKANADDKFFRQCQREAAATKHQNPSKQQQKAREAALFGKQGAKGINFDKYDAITVDVKPGAIAQNDKKNGNNRNGKNSNGNEVPANDEVTSKVFSNFDELDLPPVMRRNVGLMHYTKSTPIQRHAIPLGVAGHDLMCCAQTGSGKTCAFLLPVCASLATQKNDDRRNDDSDNQAEGPVAPKCVVLAPTRELASQIELEAEKLCFDNPTLRPVAVYGGASMRDQLRALASAASRSDNATIIVATPGRLTDFVDRDLVSLHSVRYLILDEADRMLDMGFEPQIRKLVLRSGMTPKERRQTAMFSATFPDKIQILAGEFLRPSYTWIAVGRVGSTTDSITQVVREATADKRHKLQLVIEAIGGGPDGRTLVFVQKKRTATWLKKQLSKGGPDGWEHRFEPIEAVEIHGDRSQSQREAALAQFRSGGCRIMVATDVAARGLDIDGVEHVM